jgi:hypothetical protein
MPALNMAIISEFPANLEVKNITAMRVKSGHNIPLIKSMKLGKYSKSISRLVIGSSKNICIFSLKSIITEIIKIMRRVKRKVDKNFLKIYRSSRLNDIKHYFTKVENLRNE